MLLTAVYGQKITEVKTKDLPKTILKYINKSVQGATVFKSVKLEDKGVKTYNVAIDVHGRKQILVFDKSGKFLRKGDEQAGHINKNGAKHEMSKINHNSY
jgi:hypothetical protein